MSLSIHVVVFENENLDANARVRKTSTVQTHKREEHDLGGISRSGGVEFVDNSRKSRRDRARISSRTARNDSSVAQSATGRRTSNSTRQGVLEKKR